eukprot:scaffold4840_cov115-Isochrysis_galbana.AAC.10
MCTAFPFPRQRPFAIAAPSATIPIFQTHSFTIYPSRSIAEVSAQFQIRDPNVERVGPCIPPRHPMDCWHNPERTPADQPIVMPVHPSHIPLASTLYLAPIVASAVSQPDAPARQRLSGLTRGRDQFEFEGL